MVLSVANLSNRPVPFGGIYTPANRSALVGLIRVMAVRNGGTGQTLKEIRNFLLSFFIAIYSVGCGWIKAEISSPPISQGIAVAAPGYPTTQQGSKIVSATAIGAAGQGYATDLSYDGNTLVFGGVGDNGGNGAVWVYVRSGSTWSEQTKISGLGVPGNFTFGSAVAISGDGNTIAMGDTADSGGMGAVWVYVRSAGVWTFQNKLVGAGALGASPWQGYSIAFSYDGNYLAEGGPVDNGGPGATWIFTRAGAVWSPQTKLIGTGIVGGVASQGIAVSFNSDASVLAVGGNDDNGGVGAAWIFTRVGAVWTQQTKVIGAGNVGASNQGYSLSLSASGTTLAIGGTLDNGQIGATWIFTGAGAVWTQQAKLIGAGAVGNAGQGVSVSLSDDGTRLFASGHLDDANRGAGWLFNLSGGTWSQYGPKLVGTGVAAGSYSGISSSISGDGATACIGGDSDAGNTGAIWVFAP